MTSRPQGLRAHLQNARVSFGLRWKRRRLLLRGIRALRDLKLLADRTNRIDPGAVLVVACIRNEAVRLPFFLDHYRKLGVGHFLIVDNDSTDGTVALLGEQPDVSLWSAQGNYRDARFGVDWSNGLLRRYAHGHWTLTVDADELLVYPYWETRDLRALTYWLDRCGTQALAAMMLDLYPKGPLTDVTYTAGQDPCKVLTWFDAGDYSVQLQPKLRNLWIQGGVRGRVFFAQTPHRAPTLGKLPFVKWNRRFAYVNSTHSILPRRLNVAYATDGGELTSGLLLHTKFLPQIVDKSDEEILRRQHFAEPDAFVDYHRHAASGPDLWCDTSTPLGGWRKFEALGLMSRGGWT
jgi:Glycosyl transferase family 2